SQHSRYFLLKLSIITLSGFALFLNSHFASCCAKMCAAFGSHLIPPEGAEMTEVKHTPTPWKISDHSLEIFGSDGFEICDPEQGPHVSEQWTKEIKTEYRHWSGGEGTDHKERSFEEMEANAEFIVRACNSHYDLVAALEKAGTSGKGDIENEWYCPVCGSHSFYDYDMEHKSECFIGQALAKAKAQS
uniref:hypothetical protein n=1 Tax=Dyadobacter bucti TaxID=2572203 RepID=UPI00197AE932